jgi:cob(I)alamin adenosyltransferase
MKIYTKTGDDGSTGLFGGERVHKSDPRIDCYGMIDELNASIGLCAVVVDQEMQTWLHQIQHELFNIGSHLATPPESRLAAQLPPLEAAMIQYLENLIDWADSQLPKLRQFILPAGSEPACRLHLARTICRRAERRVARLAKTHSVPEPIVVYLNRLSDWLFVMARLANHRAGVSDVPWKKESKGEQK